MSIELQNEIKQSLILSLYNKFSKLAKYIPTLKWIIGISFAIGFVDTVLDGTTSKFSMWINVGVWIPGLIFAFTGSILHFLTGLKLRKLSKKYDMNQERVQKIADEILN